MKFILHPGAKRQVFCLSLLIGSLVTLVDYSTFPQGNSHWGVKMLIDFMAHSGACFFGILAVLACKKSGKKAPDIAKLWPLVAIAFVLGILPSLIGTAGGASASGDLVQIFRTAQ